MSLGMKGLISYRPAIIIEISNDRAAKLLKAVNASVLLGSQDFIEFIIRTIGPEFGIRDAAVAQSFKRFNLKLEKDRKLRERIERFEKRVFLSNVET